MKKNNGFTLIELLVVIAIIGILASVILASLNTARAKARDARRLADMRQLKVALELYRDSAGSYPTVVGAAGSRESSCYTNGGASTPQGEWVTALTPLVTAGYLPSLPVDPQNKGTGSGGVSQTCYTYYRGNSTSDSWVSCRNPQTGEVLQPGNYEYFLFLSLENPPANRFMLNWNGSATPPSNYCIPGPAR